MNVFVLIAHAVHTFILMLVMRSGVKFKDVAQDVEFCFGVFVFECIGEDDFQFVPCYFVGKTAFCIGVAIGEGEIEHE